MTSVQYIFIVVLLGGLALVLPVLGLVVGGGVRAIVLIVVAYVRSKANPENYARKAARVVRTTGLVLRADESAFFYGNSDGTVHVIDVESGTQLACLTSGFSCIHSLAISPDGEHLVAADERVGSLIVWEWGTWACLQRLEYSGDNEDCLNPQFSADGTVLEVSDQAWEWRSGTAYPVLRTELPGAGRANSAEVSPDSRLIAMGRFDVVELWDRSTRKLLRTLQGHNSWPVSYLTFSPDGCLLASGTWEGVIRLWQVGTGRLLWHVMVEHVRLPVYLCFRFSSDGNQLIAGDAMGAVLVWDARTGIVRHILRSGDTSQVNCLVFSHDGKYLLVGMGGTRVMRWHLESTGVIALPKLLTVDGWANVPSL